jgi:hypothetical protein
VRAWAAGLLPLLATAAPLGAAAQATVAVRLGAAWSSAVVRDSIVEPIRVRAGVSPLLAASLGLPLERGVGLDVDLSAAWPRFTAVSGTGSFDLGRGRVTAGTIGLSRALGGRLRGRIGVGLVRYGRAGGIGVFRSGGSSEAGLSMAVERPVGGPRRGRRLVRLSYEAHRFLTPAMRADGFGSGQIVHRIALSVGAARALGGGGRRGR